jgi:hypothetical protein
MEPSAVIVIVVLAGYVVALPVLVSGLRDLAHIPGGVWRHAAQRPREQWRFGMICSYLLAGWPSIVSVIRWRRSQERRDLFVEWAILSERKKAARARAVPPRAAADPSRRMGRADA